jgi:hypothetical protein
MCMVGKVASLPRGAGWLRDISCTPIISQLFTTPKSPSANALNRRAAMTSCHSLRFSDLMRS